MGFEMTKKAKKKTGGFEATSKLTIDRAQERKENKKELSKVNTRLGRYSDFSRRYNSFLESSNDYLSRRDTDSPFSEGSKNKNTNRPTSEFIDRSDAFRRGTTASDWSDPTKAAKLGTESESIKTEAEKLLQELEADREYMTEEGYRSYKEFLTAVSKGDTAQIGEAFKSEAKARSYFKTEDNYKKAVSAAEKNKELGITDEMLTASTPLEKYTSRRSFGGTSPEEDKDFRESLDKIDTSKITTDKRTEGSFNVNSEKMYFARQFTDIDAAYKRLLKSSSEGKLSDKEMREISALQKEAFKLKEQFPDNSVVSDLADEYVKLLGDIFDSNSYLTYTGRQFTAGIGDWGSGYEGLAIPLADAFSKGKASREINTIDKYLNENPNLREVFWDENTKRRIAQGAGVTLDSVELYRKTNIGNSVAYHADAHSDNINEKYKKFGGSLARAAGNQVMNAAMSFGLGAGGAASEGSALTSTVATSIRNAAGQGAKEVFKAGVKGVGKGLLSAARGNLSTWMMGASAAGNKAAQNAIEYGDRGQKQVFLNHVNAFLTGYAEVFTEGLLGSDTGYGVGKFLDSATGSRSITLSKRIANAVLSAAGEGFEEAINEPLQGFADKAFLDRDKPWAGEGGVFDPDAMLSAGMSGAVMGSVFGVVGTVSDIASVFSKEGESSPATIRAQAERINKLINTLPEEYRFEKLDLNLATVDSIKEASTKILEAQNAQLTQFYRDNLNELIEKGLSAKEDTKAHEMAASLFEKLNAGEKISDSEITSFTEELANLDKDSETLEFEKLLEAFNEGDSDAASAAASILDVTQEDEYSDPLAIENIGESDEYFEPLWDEETDIDTDLEDSEYGTNSTQKVDNKETVSADRAAMETGEPTLIDAVEGDSGSLEAASKKYGAQAGAMTAVYREGQDIAKFDNAFRNAYNMGISGVPLPYAMNSSATSYLSEAQRENAWRIGTDAADLVARIKDEHYGKGKKNGIRKKGTVRGDGITLEELRAELNDTQNTALGLLRTYAEATGINIVLYKSEINEKGEFVGAQGKFSLSEDTIYIDINAGLHLVKTDKLNLSQYTMMRTFSHEFVHFCEKWNPVQYNEFRRLVFDRLTEQGVDVDELILIKQEQYGDVSYDGASREVIAEAMVDILPDSHFMEEIFTKHKNIFTKLIEKLKEFLSTLRDHFKSLTKSTDRGAAALKEQVGDGIRYFDDIVKAYDKMALEAVENYQAETVEKVSETVDETAVIEEAIVENADTENNKAITAEKTAQISEIEEVDGTFIDPLEGEDLGENPFEPIIVNEGTKKAAEDGGEVQYSFRTSKSGMANDALIPYNDELIHLIGQKGGIIVDNYQKLVETVNLAFDETNHKATVYFGTIPPNVIDNIEKSIPNIPSAFDGHIFKKEKVYSIAATLDSIRHIVDDKNGLTRADVIEYLDRLADTIIDFDSVAFDFYTDSMGNRVPGVLFKKQFADGRVQSFDIVSHGQRSLKLQTVYLEKAAYNANKKKAATALPLNNTTAHTPKAGASQPSNSSLSKPKPIVNSNLQNSTASATKTDPKADPDQRRSDVLSDREILYRAAEGMNALELSEGETGALEIFKKHLDRLDELQRQRDEQGRIYREQMFTKGGDRAEAQKTLSRMKTLDSQIKRENEKLLSIEDKDVLRRVLSGARKVIEAEGQKKTKEILRRAKDRRENSADIRKYRSRIERDSKTLSDWILNPNNKDITKHVPEVLREAVIPFLQSIDFTSKRQLRGGEATKADAEFAKRLRALDRAVRENVSPEGLYSGYIDLPPYFLGMLDACKSNIADIIGENNGSFVINQMTSEELKNLSEVVKALKKAIVEFNKFHSNSVFAHVYEAGENSIDFMQSLNKNSEGIIASKVSDFIKWKQMRPSYAFERFGKGGMAVYDGLRRGQARLAFNTKEIIDFSENAYTEKEVKDWEKEIHEFELGGDTVNIPVSFIMGLREIVKRGQGQGHVFGDGIRIATFTREGKKISDSGHLITEEEAATICSVLTDRQKEVADALQHFMADTGGKWGNEVSVARYGEKLFGEENYYPLSSDGRQLPATAEETPDSQGLYALLNMGFTKELTENASNRVIVYSIFDVFANHMASMAQYNALALPVLDTIKWFNYKQKTEFEDGSSTEGTSVREEMARVYGSPEETTPGKGKPGYAESFITGIIRSFSGTEAQGVSTDSLGLKALKNYNVAQVAYNVRVVVQQPMAVTRAALLLDYRSIVRGIKLKPAVIKKNIEEMRKYSGIALWKDLGFYDVNISRGVTDLIKHDRSVMDKIIDVGMWGAGSADTLTWAAIWSATKEQIMKDRGIKPGDDGFFEAVTTLFEDVIYKTQVVDSVLTKNEFLRSKGLFARATGAFMSEPTTSASMLISSVEKIQLDMQRGFSFAEAWKKNKKIVGRTFVVYCVGQVLLAAAQAVVDAWRDDDEYENFGEKWLEAFFGNLVDELMPFNKLPIIGDIYDLAKEVLAQFTDLEIYGNPPSSIYMQWYDYVVKGVEILADKLFGEDTNYTWYGAIYKLLQAVSGMTGLPLAATTRELVSAWNNIIGYMAPSLKLKSYDSGDKNEIKYAYQDGYLTEEEAIKLILESGEVEDENEAYFTIQSWGSEGDYSRFDLVFDAVYEGKDTDFAIEELCKHGYTEKEITSKVITQIGKWYYDDESDRRISKADAIKMLDRYTELSEKEITEKVNRWTCKVATGIAYEDIKEKYLSGEITKKRACEMYSVYGSITKDEAREKVEKIKYIADFEKEYPHVEGVSYNRAKLYREYGESAGIDISVFLDTLEYKSSVSSEKDADGNVTLTAKDKVIDYIDELKLSDDKKDALYLACEYAESGLWKTPWN